MCRRRKLAQYNSTQAFDSGNAASFVWSSSLCYATHLLRICADSMLRLQRTSQRHRDSDHHVHHRLHLNPTIYHENASRDAKMQTTNRVICITLRLSPSTISFTLLAWYSFVVYVHVRLCCVLVRVRLRDVVYCIFSEAHQPPEKHGTTIVSNNISGLCAGVYEQLVCVFV